MVRLIMAIFAKRNVQRSNSLTIHEDHIWGHRVQCVNAYGYCCI